MTTSSPPPSVVERLRHDLHRIPAWGYDTVLAFTVLAMVLTSGALRINDWIYYRAGARLLFGNVGLNLYAVRPGIQIGPLALAFAAPLDALGNGSKVPGSILAAALLIPALALTRAVARDALGATLVERTLLPGTLLVALGWFTIVAIGQYGDALALVGTLVAMRQLQLGRPAIAGVAFALGVAAKPWTFAALPVLLLAPGRGRVRAMVAAAVVIAATWLPFVISDHRTLHAGRAVYVVPPDAWQRLVGIGDVGPWWWRAAQLLVCWLVALPWVVRAGRTGDFSVGVIEVAAITALVRLMTELGTWGYYVAAALPLVLGLELVRRSGRFPTATALLCVAIVNLEPVIGGTAAAIIRLALLVAALVVCVRATNAYAVQMPLPGNSQNPGQRLT